jgi:Pin2-interacting protein X1
MAEAKTATRPAAKTVSLMHLAGSKLRNRLKTSQPMDESASEGVTSKFARRQLEKLGWKEGEGLGKRRDGMSTHIKVKRRADEQGGIGTLSSDSVMDQLQIGNDWWKHSVGDTLAKLAAKAKSSKQKKKKKSSKSKNGEDEENDSKKKRKKDKKDNSKKRLFTDDELFLATGGARFGMRAQTQQKSKWKRAESALSEQEEQDARNKIEWNGQTAPVVLLSSSEQQQPKRKKQKLGSSSPEEKDNAEDNNGTVKKIESKSEDEEEETEEQRKKRRKEEKKKRKEEKQRSSDNKDEEAEETTTTQQTKRKKKKRKSEE